MLVTVITESISSPGPDTISTTDPTTDPSTTSITDPPTTASYGQPSARPLILITRTIQICSCLFYFTILRNPYISNLVFQVI